VPLKELNKDFTQITAILNDVICGGKPSDLSRFNMQDFSCQPVSLLLLLAGAEKNAVWYICTGSL